MELGLLFASTPESAGLAQHLLPPNSDLHLDGLLLYLIGLGIFVIVVVGYLRSARAIGNQNRASSREFENTEWHKSGGQS